VQPLSTSLLTLNRTFYLQLALNKQNGTSKAMITCSISQTDPESSWRLVQKRGKKHYEVKTLTPNESVCGTQSLRPQLNRSTMTKERLSYPSEDSCNPREIPTTVELETHDDSKSVDLSTSTVEAIESSSNMQRKKENSNPPPANASNRPGRNAPVFGRIMPLFGRVAPLPVFRTNAPLVKMTAPPISCGNFVALDCEMVGVGPYGKRSALARVSLVGSDGSVLLDKFVRVGERVTDFRTHVSGICPGDVSGPNAIDFEVVRHVVATLICNRVLVGHGLQNDLSVLQLTHPFAYTRDTSLYEPFMRFDCYTGTFKSRKLSALAYQYLGYIIQNAASHDSCEDALAALNLYYSVQDEWEGWWKSKGVFLR